MFAYRRLTPLLALLLVVAGCGPEEQDDAPVTEGVYSPPDRQELVDRETEWLIPSEYLYMTLPAASDDGTLYVGAWDGKLYSVTTDGDVNWTFETGAKIDAAPTVDDEDRVITGSWDGSLYVIDDEGDEEWSLDLQAPIDASATVDDEDRIYAVNTTGRLVRLESDGDIDWDIELGAPATTSISVFEDDNDLTAYVGTSEPSLKCIRDGAVAETETLPAQPIQDIALTEDGDALVSVANGRMVRIDSDCSTVWTAHFSYPVVQAPIVDALGRAIAGVQAEHVHAVDLESGEDLWGAQNRRPGQPLYGLHAGNDDKVYAGVYGVVSVDGEGQVEVLAELDVLSTPIVVDGAAFATTERGELVRLTVSIPPLAATSWPTQHGNNQRTGYLRGQQ